MKVLRIKLRQSKASYTREETVDNRMTYPLPPFSTVIGALHNACGYEEYHPMDISIQGKYGSMQKEIFVSHGLLNNRHDDRNILVYLQNPNLLTAGYHIVGEGLKGQGNSFLERKTVRIDNEKLYKKYIDLEVKKSLLNKRKAEELSPKVSDLKEQEKKLKTELKALEKKSPEAEKVKYEINKIKEEYKDLENSFKEEYEREYSIPSSHFRTLVKAPKFQEVLYEVELLIHIKAEESILSDISGNIQNFTCLGRSEDFVDLLECKEVEVFTPEDNVYLKHGYKIYANIDQINPPNSCDKPYIFLEGKSKIDAKGTVYYLNKNYEIIDNKRSFYRVPCIYSSRIANLDEVGMVDEDEYIVSLN